jgi:hypothetical protein
MKARRRRNAFITKYKIKTNYSNASSDTFERIDSKITTSHMVDLHGNFFLQMIVNITLLDIF